MTSLSLTRGKKNNATYCLWLGEIRDRCGINVSTLSEDVGLCCPYFPLMRQAPTTPGQETSDPHRPVYALQASILARPYPRGEAGSTGLQSPLRQGWPRHEVLFMITAGISFAGIWMR